MKIIKKLLYRIFGLKSYLEIVSSVYIKYIKLGKGRDKYPELYYLKNIIKSGDTCIDIGANVGYYSVFMSEFSGSSGKVIAIEPVPLFAEIWRKNIRKTGFDNCTLYQYALGEEDKSVKMGMPMIDGIIHHGMTKIISGDEKPYERLFDVEMRVPDEIFKHLDKIDFIKVDIEGYESIAFENMKDTLKKHRPLIQSELSGDENRRKTMNILMELSYVPHILENGQLIKIDPQDASKYHKDFYFVQ